MKFSKSLAKEILDILLSTGGDYSEIYFQDRIAKSYSRRYKQVHAVNTSQTFGVGLRILSGENVLYGYTSDLSKKSLIELANSLASGLNDKRKINCPDLVIQKVKNLNKIKIPHNSWDDEKKLAYLLEGEKVAFDYSKCVVDVNVGLFEEDEHVEIYNSDGKIVSDDRVRTRLSGLVISSDGKSFQQCFSGPGLSKGLELLDDIDFKKMMEEVAKDSVDLLSAINCPSGTYPVVIGNNFGGVLFHEACGHPLEGNSVSHNNSPFANKLGKKIASDVVSAIDDGTIENGWGTISVDDEGVLPTKNQLIKNGELTSYMLDRYTSKKINGKYTPTGSCRRQSYRYVPTTRMTNTYIDAGPYRKEEIIESVKDGIYCRSFTGGQVNPATDQFMFTSDVAFLIKDGKITKMIKPISLIGYGYEILEKITMVGNDLGRAAGVCGSSSGSCFVEVGQPTLLVSSILVGGQ